MRKYSSYKDSGVEWIGEIPSHWDKKRLKHLVSYKNGYSFKSDDFSLEEEIPVIRIGDVSEKINFDRCIKLPVHFLEDYSEFIVKRNDILIGLTGGTIGKSCKYNYDNPSLLNQRVCLLRNNNELINQNLYFYVKSEVFIRYIFYECYGGGQDNIGKDEILNMVFPLPPFNEQKQIVTFLDHKTQKIDKLIEITEQKIELLKEKRTSLINHCVTKGLDPNVEMKDSGVEWIGEIPSHWEIKKGKYILKILTGNYPKDLTEDLNGISFFKVDDLNNTEQNYFIHKSNLIVKEDKNLVPLEENIILFPKRGMTIFTNKVVISKVKSYLDPNLMGVRIFGNSDIKFILLCIKNRGLGDICDSSTIPQINNKHIYPLEFPSPPLHEQRNIVEFIDTETQKIDTLIDKESIRIELLKEYRQSLISNVVTGKIDVRQEVVQ